MPADDHRTALAAIRRRASVRMIDFDILVTTVLNSQKLAIRMARWLSTNWGGLEEREQRKMNCNPFPTNKLGYEINFNRHFYTYTPPRPLEEIDAELKEAEAEIMRLLREVTE